MKILSNAEGREWLKRNCQIEDKSLIDFFGHSAACRLPSDSGRKTAVARALRDSLIAPGEGVLWITGWGVWPSSENIRLFDGYRRSLGEHRSLHEAPFHLFKEADLPDMECLLDLTLYFFWDAILIDGAQTAALRISHDEYIEAYAKQSASLSALIHVLEHAGLQRMKP